MNEFKPENPQLWELCMKHGSILAKHQKVSQVAILEMYDEIQQLQNTSSNRDYAICTNEIMELFDSENNLYRHTLKRILQKHFA